MPFLAESKLRIRGATLLVWLIPCGCATVLDVAGGTLPSIPGRSSVDGRLLYAELTNRHPVVRDPAPHTLLTEIGQSLVGDAAVNSAWTFQVVGDERPLAAALPGYRVVVTDARLAQCRTKGDVAAVLAHEMGHLLAGHGFDRIRSSGGYRAATPATMLEAFGYADTPGFTLDQQAEAAAIGISLLVTAGYDPSLLSQTASSAGDSALAGELKATMAHAQAIYDAHPHQRGRGDPVAFQRQPALVKSNQNQSHNQHQSPRPPPSPDNWSPTFVMGDGKKPSGWNADLQDDAWERPAHGEVMQAGFDGPALHR